MLYDRRSLVLGAILQQFSPALEEIATVFLLQLLTCASSYDFPRWPRRGEYPTNLYPASSMILEACESAVGPTPNYINITSCVGLD